jgi:hypothetical protein
MFRGALHHRREVPLPRCPHLPCSEKPDHGRIDGHVTGLLKMTNMASRHDVA